MWSGEARNWNYISGHQPSSARPICCSFSKACSAERGVCICCMSSHIQPTQLCQPNAASPWQSTHGRPSSTVAKDSNSCCSAVRKVCTAIKNHSCICSMPNYNAVGIIYVIFFSVTGSAEQHGAYIGITHRNCMDRFRERMWLTHFRGSECGREIVLALGAFCAIVGNACRNV